MGGVALIGDRLVVNALQLASPPLDGPLDGVQRHRSVTGLLEHGAQGGIGVGIAAALTGRHLDLLDELGEELPPLGVSSTLLVLDGRPLGMTGHICFPSRSSVTDDQWSKARSRNRAWIRVSPDISGWKDDTMTVPWRHSTGASSTVANTSTSSPTRSTTGARMKTP